MKKILLIVGLALFVALMAAAAALYNSLSGETPPLHIEAPENDTRVKAPDFTTLDAEGNNVLFSDYIGKPIVLNFWASWCPPCKEEMPDFNKVYEEMGSEITFVMVDLVDGMRETKEKGEKYVAEQGFTFPVYYDIKGEAGRVYGVSSIPTTIFIDKEGYIITGVRGMIDEGVLREAIQMVND